MERPKASSPRNNNLSGRRGSEGLRLAVSSRAAPLLTHIWRSGRSSVERAGGWGWVRNRLQNGDARRLNFGNLAQHLASVASWHPYATAPAHPPAGKRECPPRKAWPGGKHDPRPAAAAGWGWELKGHRRPRPLTPPTHPPPPPTATTHPHPPTPRHPPHPWVARLWWAHSGGVAVVRVVGWVQRWRRVVA